MAKSSKRRRTTQNTSSSHNRLHSFNNLFDSPFNRIKSPNFRSYRNGIDETSPQGEGTNLRPNNRYKHKMLKNPANGVAQALKWNSIKQSFLSQDQLAERLKVCNDRRQRREVLHAKGIAGSKVSQPLFTQKSKVRC